MEWRKKRLRDEVAKLSSSTQYLKKSLRWYGNRRKERDYIKLGSTTKSKERCIRKTSCTRKQVTGQ
jgi:hypothetical protein